VPILRCAFKQRVQRRMSNSPMMPLGFLLFSCCHETLFPMFALPRAEHS